MHVPPLPLTYRDALRLGNETKRQSALDFAGIVQKGKVRNTSRRLEIAE